MDVDTKFGTSQSFFKERLFIFARFIINCISRQNLVVNFGSKLSLYMRKRCHTIWYISTQHTTTSAFGVTLDSSVKSRQDSKQNRRPQGDCNSVWLFVILKLRDRQLVNALHIMKWWFLVWFGQQTPAIRPRSEMVRRRSRRVKIWAALFNGP